jgi:HEAT repeat protein
MSLADLAADPGAAPHELIAAITAVAPGEHGALVHVLPLAAHPVADVRAAAVSTLPLLVGAEPPAEVVDAILALTSDADDNVRFWACWALDPEIFGTDGARLRDAFAARLDDPADDVRCEALYWLAYLRDERALPLIKAALSSRRPLPREVDAAGAFGDPALYPLVYAHRGTAHPQRLEAVRLARRLLSPDGVGDDLLAALAASCRRRTAFAEDLPEHAQWWQLTDELTSVAAYRAPGIAAEVAALLAGDDAALALLREQTGLGRLARKHGWT